MRIRTGALGGLIAGALTASLIGGVAAQSSPPPSGHLANTAWLLTAVGDTAVAKASRADILFTTDQDRDAEAEAALLVAGFAGCNRFVGSYTTDGTSSLAFGPLATTMRLCDDAANALEQSYLSALAMVVSYAIGADGGLTLADATGTAALTYVSMAPASVEGAWDITQVNNGKDAVSSVPEGITATVTFHPDGIVEGFDGCNSFSGGYGVTGETLRIGPLMGTMMACDETTNTFAQQYLTALQASTYWAVITGVLRLSDDSGATQVGAARPSAD